MGERTAPRPRGRERDWFWVRSRTVAVLRLLRGEDLDTVSRELAAPAQAERSEGDQAHHQQADTE